MPFVSSLRGDRAVEAPSRCLRLCPWYCNHYKSLCKSCLGLDHCITPISCRWILRSSPVLILLLQHASPLVGNTLKWPHLRRNLRKAEKIRWWLSCPEGCTRAGRAATPCPGQEEVVGSLCRLPPISCCWSRSGNSDFFLPLLRKAAGGWGCFPADRVG